MNMALDFHVVGDEIRDTAAPAGPIEKRWDEHRAHMKPGNTAKRRKTSVIMDGTGPPGA